MAFCFFERGYCSCRKHAFLNGILSNWSHIGLNPSFHMIKEGLLHLLYAQISTWGLIPWTHWYIIQICSASRNNPYEWLSVSQLLISFWGAFSGFYPIFHSHFCQLWDLEMRLLRYHRSCMANGRQKVKEWIRLMSYSGLETEFVLFTEKNLVS